MTNRKNLYGYRIEDGALAVCPDEMAVVERAATLYLAGASYQTITDKNRAQHHTKGLIAAQFLRRVATHKDWHEVECRVARKTEDSMGGLARN